MFTPLEKRKPAGGPASEGAFANGGMQAKDNIRVDVSRSRPREGTVGARVLEALEAGRALTPLDCWRDFGSSRLAAHVFILRRMGWPIVAVEVPVPARDGRVAHVARYTLEGAP